MIEQNYYQGFQRLCDRNEKMARIPTKDELEKMECEVSGMCYLITKDGKQYNPATVNPEIMDDHIRMMFTSPVLPAPVLAPTPYRPKPIEVPKMVHTEKDSPVGKVCTQCGSGKTIDQFGKKQGRGGHRKDICIDCEVKNRLKALEEITQSLEPKQEVKHEIPNAHFISLEEAQRKIVTAFQIPSEYLDISQKEKAPQPLAVGHIGVNADKPSYVTIERVKELVTEAYQVGVKDGKQQAALNIIEPTLN